MLSEQYYKDLDELEHQINECANPNYPACVLCPLFEVCDFDPEIPDELISLAETACGM